MVVERTASEPSAVPVAAPTPWLIAAVVVALLLRLHCLVFPNLWLDEYVTLWSIAGTTYAEMFDRAARWTASTPLFVLCYRASWDWGGHADWGLKVPGVLAGTLNVVAMWWATKKLIDRDNVAIVAAWVVALDPQFVHYSQEARPYTGTVLLITMSLGSLASWFRTGRRFDLALNAVCSLAAVGFHMVAVLAVAVQSAAGLMGGWLGKWTTRRWGQWLLGQILIACGLYLLLGVQYGMLRANRTSRVVNTALPMLSHTILQQSFSFQMHVSILFASLGLTICWCLRLFPQSRLRTTCVEDKLGVGLSAASFLVPVTAVCWLSSQRVLDSWPRYYFLFDPGYIVCLAWVLVRVIPRRLAYCLAGIVGLSMAAKYSLDGGLPFCRLGNGWRNFSTIRHHISGRTGPDDLVISRSGLVEANQARFLREPTGASYLRCFLEAKDGPLAAEHIALPFSPEGEEAVEYLDWLMREKLLDRADFWLVNAVPQDFDYREWLGDQLADRFRVAEQIEDNAWVMCHYVRLRDPE